MVNLDRGPYSRTGIRRSGDDYQDAVALDVLVDWLANPDAVEYVRVEADDAGALDDVVLVRHDSVVAIQVKFSGYPDQDGSTWSLSSLLAPGAVSGAGSRRRASLLEKWLRSLDVLGASHPGRAIDARVVTNRSPGNDLASALTDAGTLDLRRVEDDGIRAQVVQLIEELGQDTAVLSYLRFQFNHPGLEDLEDSARHKFLQLGFDERGWLSLNNRLRRWIRRRREPSPDGRISLAAVRHASEWRELRGLPQEFPVPADYVSPSHEFDVETRTAIDSAERCHVIVASPGLGKSTYVSALCRRLKEEQYPVVRHHYFLSRSEHAGRRLKHRDAAESLLHDLKRDYRDALGAMAAHQLRYADLREALGQCGAYYEQQGRRLVVLLDGLDHVWREKRSAEELAQLLDEFFPLPSGVVLVVATQPVADEQLPFVLLQAVPRHSWKELPRLDRRATTEWVKKHGTEFDLVDDAGSRAAIERLADAFFESSNGHPLHLRYSLEALLQKSLPISEYSVSELPPCPTGEITDYYEGLVRALDEAAHFALLLIACGDFPWPRSGLLDCLVRLGVDRLTASRGLTQVIHLLRRGPLGLWPFHSSLLVFVRSTEHYIAQQRAVGAAVVQWLQNHAPAYWRWAYEWRLRAQLGEVEPLREGPTRAWVLEAIAMRRPAPTTEKILAQSGALALTPHDLPTALQRGVSCLYFSDAYEFRRDEAESALFAQLGLGEDEFLLDWLSEDIAHLTPAEVCLLAERADASERPFEVERCYEELRRRVNNGELNEATDNPWTERMAPMYRIATIARKLTPAVDFALVQGADGRRLIRHMVEEMRIRRDADGLREALRLAQEWMPDERRSIDRDARHSVVVELLNGLILLALEESLDVSDAFVGREELEALPLVSFYQSSRGHRVASPVELPVLGLPDVRHLAPEQTIGLREVIRDVFLVF